MFTFKKTPRPLDRYVDPTGEFSNRALEAGTWYVRHRELFTALFRGVLLVWSVGSVTFGLVFWGYYLFFGRHDDERLIASIAYTATDYTPLHVQMSARPLVVGPTDVLDDGSGRYTFLSTLTNSNEAWMARVTYHVQAEGEKRPAQYTTVLPGVTMPLVVFGEEFSTFPANGELVLDRVEWQRIPPFLGQSPRAVAAERLQFAVENIEILDGAVTGLPLTQLRFSVKNNTVYGYREVPFVVELLDAGTTIMVLPLRLAPVGALQTVPVDLRVNGVAARTTEVRIFPLVNVFDRSVFLVPPS